MVVAKLQCICQICTCGKHRCPVHPNKKPICTEDQPCICTEYNTQYKEYPGILPPTSHKPDAAWTKPDIAFQDRTEFKDSFIQHNLEKTESFKPSVEYTQKHNDTDFYSTYNIDFNEKECQPVKPITNQQKRADLPSFEGHPTYKEDFKPWNIDRTKSFKKDVYYKPPTIQMDGKTTFNTHYIPRDAERTKSFKPEKLANLSKEPFSDQTLHRTCYKSHPIEYVPKAKKKDKYQLPTEPIETTTTSKRDFIPHDIVLTKSFKPENVVHLPDVNIEDRTEFKDNFKEWAMVPRKLPSKKSWEKPTEEMESTTVAMRDFTGQPGRPADMIKPKIMQKAPDVKFQDHTTHKDNFKIWQCERTAPYDRKKPYEPSQIPFEAKPIYSSFFVNHGVLDKVPLIRSSKGPQLSSEPLNSDTTYKKDYRRNEIEVCPVLRLAPLGYKYEETSKTGHKFYSRT